jgi:hypothetical protein
MNTKPVLRLTLKKKWFDMILLGQKREEYREIKPHWTRIFYACNIKVKGRRYHPTDVLIEFRNGYRKDSPRMIFECLGLWVGFANPDWIERPNSDQFYVISLGAQNTELNTTVLDATINTAMSAA